MFDLFFAPAENGMTVFSKSDYSFRAAYVKHEFKLGGRTATLFHVATMNAAQEWPEAECFAEEMDARIFIIFKYKSYHLPTQLIDEQDFTEDEVKPIFKILSEESAMAIMTSHSEYLMSFIKPEPLAANDDYDEPDDDEPGDLIG